MTNMYGSAGNTADAPSDSLHLLGFRSDCQETTADINAENGLLSTSLSNPEHFFSDFLCPQDIQNLDDCFKISSLPVTPLEPSGQHQKDASCPPGGPERVGGVSLFLEEDNVFKFPPPSCSASTSFLPWQLSSMTSPGFEATFMDTPPATPTDFDCQSLVRLPGQQILPPQPTGISYGPQPLLLYPPPHRQRLHGVSSIEDADFQDDLVVQEDINVFSDKKLTTCEENKMSQAASLEPPLMSAGENLEPRLREAWERSQGSQSLAPLLKEELRLKIMKKRLDSGQEELKVDFTQSPCYQMTEEDEAKRNVRRAQNRGAAQRFRQRKKGNEIEMIKKLEENLKRNGCLHREVELLRREVARLQQLLLQHRHCRDCRLPPATPPSFLSVPNATAYDDDEEEDEDFKALCQRIVEEISSMQTQP